MLINNENSANLVGFSLHQWSIEEEKPNCIQHFNSNQFIIKEENFAKQNKTKAC